MVGNKNYRTAMWNYSLSGVNICPKKWKLFLHDFLKDQNFSPDQIKIFIDLYRKSLKILQESPILYSKDVTLGMFCLFAMLLVFTIFLRNCFKWHIFSSETLPLTSLFLKLFPHIYAGIKTNIYPWNVEFQKN